MTPLNHAIARAVETMPASQAALAREADVPTSTLSRIISGELNASPDVARRIMAALRRWKTACGQGADAIADTLIADSREEP